MQGDFTHDIPFLTDSRSLSSHGHFTETSAVTLDNLKALESLAQIFALTTFLHILSLSL